MMFLGLRKLGNICCGHKMFLNKIKKHFLCPGHKICVRNKCCPRRQTGKHLCRQQCVRNNVSSFARALSQDGCCSVSSFRSREIGAGRSSQRGDSLGGEGPSPGRSTLTSFWHHRFNNLQRAPLLTSLIQYGEDSFQIWWTAACCGELCVWFWHLFNAIYNSAYGMNVKTLQIPHPFWVIWWRNFGDLGGEILMPYHTTARPLICRISTWRRSSL